MNHFDEYTLKILKCTESILIDVLSGLAYKDSKIVLKKRSSKNCVIYYLQLNPFELANIKTLLYRHSVPYFIRAKIHTYGVGICWTLNKGFSLSHIVAHKVKQVDWLEQEQAYKTYQLLKITG